MHIEIINSNSDLALRLHAMANKNLEELAGKAQTAEEVQDYYLGMLRRQSMLTYDLGKMLRDRPAENLTTPYILLRTLMDDFIHLLYLELSENREEEIVKINADGNRDNFNSLKNLTNSGNQTYFNESFGYLSPVEFDELKDTFKNKPENHKYFIDRDNFKFKKPPSLTEMANLIVGSENHMVARDRALYMWKTFSSFVHYSNWCFKYEYNEAIENHQMMEEALQYTFNSIHICSYYFRKTKSTTVFVDKYILKELKFPLLDIR